MRNLILVTLFVLVSGCASRSVRIATHGTKVATADGNHVWSYLLHPSDGPAELPREPRAVVFYVAGSGYERSVLSVTGAMAGFVMMGMPTVLLERRGIGPHGASDASLARRYADRPTRVADALVAMREHLDDIPAGTPVLVVGESEGGAVATAVARAEPRITHVILLGAGGGMTQAEELALLAADPGNGYGTPAQLEAAFADIRAHPDSDHEWLGHPYRRWSSFLWNRPLDDLLAVRIPIFLAQGDRDTSVPVESARRLHDAFAESGRGHLVVYREYAGLDHGFRDEQGRSRLHMVESDVITWLRDQGLLEPGEADRILRRIDSAHEG